jgi:hypothetical protein
VAIQEGNRDRSLCTPHRGAGELPSVGEGPRIRDKCPPQDTAAGGGMAVVNRFEVTGSGYALAHGERDVPVEWPIGQVVGMPFPGRPATAASFTDKTGRLSL